MAKIRGNQAVLKLEMNLEETIRVNWGTFGKCLVKYVILEYMKQSSVRSGNNHWGSHMKELRYLWQMLSQIYYTGIYDRRSEDTNR